MPVPPDEVFDLPIDALALRILKWESEQAGQPNFYNFINMASQNYPQNGHRDRKLLEALSEGYSWLLQRGLVAPKDCRDSWMFITRKGRKVLEADNGLAVIGAEARLDVDLHLRIANRVRSQFLLGEYELAAFAAMREVEIRVRELAGADPRDVGVDLMKKAFKIGEGPLTDATSVKGEQEATMALYWGAIGVFKNPPSHRQVDYDDPTLASEVVLLADLLLRMLDARSKAMSRSVQDA